LLKITTFYYVIIENLFKKEKDVIKNFGSLSWMKSERIFGKIPTPTSDCPPPAAAGKIRGPASQDRQTGKNSLPLKPLSFLPVCFWGRRGNSALRAEKN